MQWNAIQYSAVISSSFQCCGTIAIALHSSKKQAVSVKTSLLPCSSSSSYSSLRVVRCWSHSEIRCRLVSVSSESSVLIIVVETTGAFYKVASLCWVGNSQFERALGI